MFYFLSLVCPFGDMSICADYIAEQGLIACTWANIFPDMFSNEKIRHRGNYESCCQTCGQLRDPNIPGIYFSQIPKA